MKHIKDRISILFLLSFVILFAISFSSATASAKVNCKLKGSTYIVSGKGKMTEKMIPKKNIRKKIKKLVIKKGVTSLPEDAFANCKNLKTISISSTVREIGAFAFSETAIKELTIPKTVKRIGEYCFGSCKSLKKVTMPGAIKLIHRRETDDSTEEFNTDSDQLNTVTFSTNLTLDTIRFLNCHNFATQKNDPKFACIDGVLYSKDKTTIVRVPTLRKEITLSDTCTTFDTNSITYCTYNTDYDSTGGCKKLKRITIPASVTNIVEGKYKTEITAEYNLKSIKEIKILTSTLTKKSILVLWDLFETQHKKLQKELIAHIMRGLTTKRQEK